MDPARFRELPAVITADRFSTYLAAQAGNVDQAIRLYTWNVEVSAALWGPLQAVEVALRNALHQQMRTRYQREDWWDASSVGLAAEQHRQVQRAIAKLVRRRQPYLPGHVVAELSLGFWTGLLGRGNGYEHRYWIPILRHAFPPYRGSRVDLHRRVENLRLLRNRIAHHEPIFARHLAADHSSILVLAGYMHPDVHDWISSHSRVGEVLARRQRCIDSGDSTSF
jgi:Abi-like protein